MDLEAAVDLLAELVAIDTTSSRSNLPLVERLADRLASAAEDVRLFRSPDGAKANLWARFGPEPDAARRGLILSGHTDVVPAPREGWASDPFRLADRGDRWVARGTCDMKGFLALATSVALETDRARLRHPLALLFTYDEEVGMHGAREFARQWRRDEPLPRATVIGEPTGLAVLRLHKGHRKLRVTVAGRAAHSSTPQQGENAIERAAAVVAALAALREELARERPAGGEYFPEAPFVPLNVATIAGGTAINVVPDRCVLELGYRPLPEMDDAALEARVFAAIRAAAPDATLERAGWSEPLATRDDAEIHRELSALTGQRGSRGAPFATDGGPLAALGLESVLCGPGRIEHAHRVDEWLEKDDFARAASILESLVDRFCRAA